MAKYASGFPSAVRGSNWPDGAIPLGNQRAKAKTLKSDLQRELDSRSRLVAPGAILRQTEMLPRLWGQGLGAVDARAHGAERIAVKGRGVQTVYPASDEGANRGEAKPSLVIAPDAKHDRTWAPTEAHPEDHFGVMSKMFAWAAAEPAGLKCAVRLYRTWPIVGSVAVTVAPAPEKREAQSRPARAVKVTSQRREGLAVARAAAAGVTADEIAAARAKRKVDYSPIPSTSTTLIERPVNAPPRVMFAF